MAKQIREGQRQVPALANSEFPKVVVHAGLKRIWQLRYTYRKIKAMMGQDGPRFVEWIRARFAEQRKTQLYDELDDEDEDDIILVRKDKSKKRTTTGKRKGELWTSWAAAITLPPAHLLEKILVTSWCTHQAA